LISFEASKRIKIAVLWPQNSLLCCGVRETLSMPLQGLLSGKKSTFIELLHISEMRSETLKQRNVIALLRQQKKENKTRISTCQRFVGFLVLRLFELEQILRRWWKVT
jgi:hypothetical protein